MRSIVCRRQIEKSSLAQIEMSLSTVLVGEFWADDGDCDEPDGDRPDERVAGSGCEQDQSKPKIAQERVRASLNQLMVASSVVGTPAAPRHPHGVMTMSAHHGTGFLGSLAVRVGALSTAIWLRWAGEPYCV